MSPDPAPVLDLIEAFRRSKTMFAAVKLGVFDRLLSAPADAVTLATDLHVHGESLERLLDACVALGFLRVLDGRYANEPVADAYLCRTSERTMVGYILYSNDVLFRLWTHLDDAVREGGNRWEQAFGGKGGIFDYFFKTDEDMRAFLQGMHGFGLLSSPKVVEAFDLSHFHRLVDIGGATGHLALAACDRYPQMEAAVLDLPSVVKIAKEDMRHSSANSSRIEWIAGDFFQDDLPEADLFAMGQIVHDWSEAKIRPLLSKIYRRLPVGGGLLIVEKLLADDRSGPTSVLLQSLNMLLCTEGKERTLSE
jgi:acetylserotonin N-methyltransferase